MASPYACEATGYKRMDYFCSACRTDLVDVGPPALGPGHPAHQPMLERPLGVQVSVPAGIVEVVAGVDELRVDSIDQLDLIGRDTRPIDRERIDTHVPQGDCIQRTLYQHYR